MSEKKRIIFADDAAMHRSVLKSNLRSIGSELGIEFEILGEGEDGGQLVELFGKHPVGTVDLVFSDIRMPIMDGLSALVKIKQMNPLQKMVMVSSEDMQTIDNANEKHGEVERKTVEQKQRIEMLNKVAHRIRNNVTEEGKTNSILTGCEKLALDPILIAQEYGAMGYLRKPYDPQKTKEMMQFILNSKPDQFLAKV